MEELLPFTIKGTQERLRRREENGLRVKGTGEGQKVKGKAWERTMKGRSVVVFLYVLDYRLGIPWRKSHHFLYRLPESR